MGDPRGVHVDRAEAPGLDVILRGLSTTGDDEATLAVAGPIFDGLNEYFPRSSLLGHEPARARP